jgi:predicted site-specific integrase-resolvase
MSQETERMLRPREVAMLFKVDPKTVTRWAKTGRLTPITLPSGHRRYRSSDVESLMSSSTRRSRVVESHVCPRCGSAVSCDNTSA